MAVSTPWSSTAWPAGVVEGAPVCQLRRRWLPDRSRLLRKGIAPAAAAWRTRGSATPSSCTTRSPGPLTSVRRAVRTELPMTWARKTSLELASTTQSSRAATTARPQAMSTTSRKSIGSMAGTSDSATARMSAWARKPDSSSPTTPVSTVSRVSRGRIRAPTRSTVPTSSATVTLPFSGTCSPGTSCSVTAMATNDRTKDRSTPTSQTRGRAVRTPRAARTARRPNAVRCCTWSA